MYTPIQSNPQVTQIVMQQSQLIVEFSLAVALLAHKAN